MKALLLSISVLSVIAFASCSKNDSNRDGNSQVQLLLTDAPADYDAVNLNIEKVEISVSSADSSGWVEYPLGALFNESINLLDYNNGKVVALGDPISLPAGKIEQIRLVLGDGNTVVIDGATHDLKTPSSMESGYKINFHKELQPNGVYKIWLDFDAARSIVSTKGQGYILKPVVRAFSEETNGQLRGYVLPEEAKATAYALKGTDTISAAIPDYTLNGFYHFVGLEDGTYSVSLDAADTTGYKDTVVSNLNVVFGKATDVGTITLHK